MNIKILSYNIFIPYILIGIVLLCFILSINRSKLLNNKTINENNENNENNANTNNKTITYTICKKRRLIPNMLKTLEKGNIEQVSDKDSKWDLYLPCGYNDVEQELKDIKLSNKKQKIFAINGCDLVASKNNLWALLHNKYGRVGASKIMPETYILHDSDDMMMFSQNYKPDKLYLLKKNIQQKKGIKLTYDYNDVMKARHQNYRVVQEYVNDLYLINKRKINLRLYLLITCRNGKVKGYLHKQGKCIYTNKDFNHNDLNKTNTNNVNNTDNIESESHLTSLNLNMEIYEKNPESLIDLRNHLGSRDYKTLMTRIEKNIKLMMGAVDGSICQLKKIDNNLTFQLFGADIIFTNDMIPYLLELNKGPSMGYKSPKDEELKDKVSYDVFSLVGLVPKESSLLNSKNGGFTKIY